MSPERLAELIKWYENPIRHGMGECETCDSLYALRELQERRERDKTYLALLEAYLDLGDLSSIRSAIAAWREALGEKEKGNPIPSSAVEKP